MRNYKLTILKRFIIGWLLALIVLVVISCVKYKEFIIAAFNNNMVALLNAIMPVVIICFGLHLGLKSIFPKR